MARNKKVEILSNDKEVLHPMTDGDCVIFEDGQTLAQKLSEDDSVKYTPEIVNSSPMFKVGEGNTVDYSDNVLDGAYERATLQGQTYVNYIQESSADEITLPTPFTEYERTQHNTLTSNEEGTLGINLVGQSYVNALQHDSEEEYVVLGESLEFQEKKVEYTNEGQIKSAMLKGQTLVNLANQSDLKIDNGKLTKDKGVYTVTVDSNFNSAITYVMVYSNNVHQFKPNTKYLVKANVIENNFTTTFNPCVGHGGNIFDLNETEKTSMSYQPSETGVKIGIYTTKSDFTGVTNAFRCAAGTSANPCVANQTIKFQFIFVEYQEGMENWDIPYFEGMQSVTVSTKLENLCHKYNDGLAKNGKTFNTNSLADRCIKLVDYKEGAAATYGMKPNTKYLVQFKISNLVLDGLSSLGMVFSVGESSTTNYLFKDETKHGLITANGIYRVVLTTTDLVSTSGVEIKGKATEWEQSGSTLRSLTISNIMYVEYQNGMENWDLPYFEDYQVMKPVQVESVNKNLATVNTFQLTSQSDNATGGATLNKVIEVNIPLNPSLEYMFTSDNTHITALCTNEPIPHSVYQHGHNNCYTHAMATGGEEYKYPNNLVSGYKYITITTGGATDAYEVGQTVTFNNIQLEESSTATEYVPHQSKTTYSWDEVILRKIGDVEDTLDLTTGEWVQRIGEIVLDGSDDEVWQQVGLDMWATTNGVQDSFGYIYYFQHNYKAANYITFHEQESDLYTLCDKLPVCSRLDSKLSSKTNVCTTGGATPSTIQNNTVNSYIGIKLDTTKVTTLDEFKAWLKQNPLKIQVVMNKPIIHKVNLSRPNLQVYDDITHVHTKCLDGTLIPNIYLPSDISYPAILEPSKKYNVCVNHTEVNADNPLTVNVGGTEITMTDSRMTLTTPTTLANSNVSFTGKGNKIKESMLIKNSSLLTRDLPHFNGIGSVQLGKTIKNLCGASGFKAGDSHATITWYDNYAHTNISTKTGSCVFVYELVKPLENGKKYFVYSPQTLDSGSCRASFRQFYNNNLTYAKQQTLLPKDGKCIIEIDQQNNPYTHICVGCHHAIPLNREFDVYRPIICEYELGMEDWDWESIGYFTGTKNIGNEFIKVSNSDATKYNGLYITKDQPIELTWEQGRINPSGVGDSYTNAINNAVSYGIRNKGLLNLKPNTTYRISLGDKVSFKYHIAVFDNWDNALPSVASLGISGDWISSVDTIFTTTKDAHKIGINVQKQDASSITPPESVHAQVRLEEVTDVVLRSCSSKYDELDLTRGIYTQNVGMVYLDGVNALSQQIAAVGDSYQPTDTTLKSFDIKCNGAVLSSKCSCNKFPSRDGGITSTDISFESVCIHSANVSCRLTIKKEKASTLEEFKLWLQDNPLEIIYQLKTPIVHKVHIGNKNEVNTEVTKPNNVFTLPTLYAEQTHIDMTNNGIIPKVQSRDYIAYPVSPMLSRTYTLQHNLTGGVSNLTVDLLGRTQEITYQEPKSLIYSPGTMDAILHHELRISGKGKISGVMYIDGGYMDREIPYIEGMKNAVNPIVKNVGKNLVQKIDDIWYFYENTINHGEVKHNCGIAPVKPYTQYIINKNSILCFYDENGKCTNSPFQYFNANIPRIAPSGSKYMLVRHNGGDNATYLDGLQVVEYGQEFDNQEYKENICYVDCGEIRLTPDMFEQGNIVYNGANTGATYESMKEASHIRVRMKELIKIKPNTKYLLNIKGGYKVFVREFDVNKGKLKDSALSLIEFQSRTVFTTNANTQYISLLIGNLSDTSLPLSDFDKFNLLLIEKDNMVILRSLPHGVQDEIDLETGKYIQRVGEITFNGTEDWIVGYSSWDNKYTYYNNSFVDIKTMKGDNGSGQAYYDAVRCPQLHRSYMSRLASALIDGVCSYYYSGYQRIFISKQDCATVDELKLWLQENPITVQYELPEPIVKDIVIHNYPHSYEGGHVIIENGDPDTPITAQLTYRAVTNRSGQIQQHTEQVEKQEREINELETLILANIHLSQTR